jgi:hypothetical protein
MTRRCGPEAYLPVVRRGADTMIALSQVVATYTKALETINPRKATGPLYPLYVAFAKFYEEGGSTEDKAEPDLASARKVFETARLVAFKTVEELAEIWCEWAEMELRNECVLFPQGPRRAYPECSPGPRATGSSPLAGTMTRRSV